MSEAEWRQAYINRLMERGIDRELAEDTYDAGHDSHDLDDDPEDAADEELSYWS